MKKSHIIPDCMYQEMYDENHKINVFAPGELLAGKGFIKRPSTGEYEGGLLCSKCENETLASYETYGCEFFYANEIPIHRAPKCKNFVTPEGFKFSECTNVDYEKLKLFLLSIIWRASICTRDFFREVDLEIHENRIRKMLLEKRSGTIEDYPILIGHFINSAEIPSDITIQPIRIQEDGNHQYLIIINGMIFIYQIEGEYLEDVFHDFTVKPSNEIRIFEFSDDNLQHWLFEYLQIKI